MWAKGRYNNNIVKIIARIELPRDIEREKKEYITNVIVKANNRIVYNLKTSEHIQINGRYLRFKFKKISTGDIIRFIIKYSNGDIKERKYPVTIVSRTTELWRKDLRRIGLSNEK
jgi:hypothetical protein